MWTNFKIFTEFVTVLLLSYVLIYLRGGGPRDMGISAPQPGLKLIHCPALEGEALTTGLPAETLFYVIFHFVLSWKEHST